RANYAYKDRYLFTGSLRRDGSSRFGPGNRYGTFGAASVGWVLSQEPFYPSIPLLGRDVDYFKLRVSHGVLGNQDIGDYRYSAPIVQGLNYLFGSSVVASGATQLTLANPNIRWQSNRETNVGVDLGLFQSRLTVTLDYYVSTSGGLLVDAPIPSSLGVVGTPVVNAGTIRNTGFELAATHRLERGDFQLNTSLTLMTTRNRVVALGNGGQPIVAGPFDVARTAVGSPIGTFWVLQTDGIFQSAAEVQASAQPDAKPGHVRYVDRYVDGRITHHHPAARRDRTGGREQRQPAVGSLDRERLVPADPECRGGLPPAGRRRAVARRRRRGAADLRRRANPVHVHRLFELGPGDARVQRSAGARRRRRRYLSQPPHDHLRLRFSAVISTGVRP